MHKFSWSALHECGSGNRIVVWIGPNAEHGIEAERLLNFSTTAEFDVAQIHPYRADLIAIADDSAQTSTEFLDQLTCSVHDEGMIWISSMLVEKFRSELERRGFKPFKISGLFKRAPKVSPAEYDANYLARWGNTDFMRNWKLASELILGHAPKLTAHCDLRILDVGSFNGYIMESLRRAGVREIFGVEISYDLAVRSAVNRYHLPATYVCDFLENKLPAGYFDITIAMEILEHIPAAVTKSFVAELKRVTSNQGVILISASEDWEVDPTHINCRGRDDWYLQFSKAGLLPSGSQTIFPGFNSFVLRKSNSPVLTFFYRIYFQLRAFRFSPGRTASSVVELKQK